MLNLLKERGIKEIHFRNKARASLKKYTKSYKHKNGGNTMKAKQFIMTSLAVMLAAGRGRISEVTSMHIS
jgi:hypothetical protein